MFSLIKVGQITVIFFRALVTFFFLERIRALCGHLFPARHTRELTITDHPKPKDIPMRKLTLLLLLTFIAATSALRAQNVAINETGALPDASAMLDVQSTTKGLLVPRMTAVQKSAIVAPATGLMIFQTDGVPGYYYYNGATWSQLGANGGFWSANGDHIFNTNSGRVGIGTNDSAEVSRS